VSLGGRGRGDEVVGEGPGHGGAVVLMEREGLQQPPLRRPTLPAGGGSMEDETVYGLDVPDADRMYASKMWTTIKQQYTGGNADVLLAPPPLAQAPMRHPYAPRRCLHNLEK